ncbi:MAG: prepilin-type N-terminal cleavage/methylation domain-containing protein [Verrucomicrobiaceae bacterium]|nr:prepilin-type N-terminal cleavage/methylation domain-containing protein [Verrucomicrobiaceae bacterium]
MRPSRHHSSRRAAFSLFEIVVAMTILGIISSAVLSILWQAGDTAAGIRELDQRDEEVSRFLALLRESIENLPPGGTLAMTPAEESVSGYPELVIGNSATAFTFGEIVGSSEETILSLRPGKEPPGGGAPAFALALSRADFAPEDTDGSGMAFRAGPDDFLQSDEEGRYWLPLLSGVTAASWHFWDEEQQEWIDEWTDEEKMPPLLAFSFDDNFRPVPLRVVFTVPEQVASPPAETTTATSSGATTTNRSSGGGSRAGSDGGGGDGGARSDGNQRRSGGGEARPNRGGDRPGGGAGESGNGNNSSGRGDGGNRGGGPGGGGGR